MPSGAGHDAMKLHEVMPQAMLFQRGLNAGISHNPLEAITNDDTELSVRAFQQLLEGLPTRHDEGRPHDTHRRRRDAPGTRRRRDSPAARRQPPTAGTSDLCEHSIAGSTSTSTKQVRFLQELVRVPTDTPPGHNAPHAERTAEMLGMMGLAAERHKVPEAVVKSAGLMSITNLIVRHRFGDGPTIALNAHGDVVPPGDGWTHHPYRAEIVDGKLYGRAVGGEQERLRDLHLRAARADRQRRMLRGAVELHFTYDEEFGGELGPGWLLNLGLTQPDVLIAAGFSYQVVVAHNGCLQLEVTLHGLASHAAYPETGVDALQAANQAADGAVCAQRRAAHARARRCPASNTPTSTWAASKVAPTPT